MEAQVELKPDPTKTLADYPDITANYARSDYKHLMIDRLDMQSRSKNPRGPWDKKFAHLHLEAIEAELALRKFKK